MLSLTLNNSPSNVEYFCCVGERARDQKARGCQCPFSFCSRTASLLVSDASVVRAKGTIYELSLNES
uniref:Uncharacterized protein n=1 Tax=Lepeophtheirus salmonis TaxID=72036 RepID=A0A0K2U222_LEPSM